tara:strand:- start:1920 stop:3350 length:1431 start_codon:yes stop_codon:yes gene_type:complete
MDSLDEIIKAKALLKKELTKVKSNQKRKRIISDSYYYLHFISSQFKLNDTAKELNDVEDINLDVKKRMIFLKNNLVNNLSQAIFFNISIREIIYIIFSQTVQIKKFIFNFKKPKGIYLYIIFCANKDLINHLNKKPNKGYFYTFIPYQVINFFIKSIDKESSKNTSPDNKIETLDMGLDELYIQNLKKYLMIEKITNKIIIFINHFSHYKVIKKIEGISGHQTILENYLALSEGIDKKKWLGVNIALHGGNYGLTYGYPIMWYHCLNKYNEKTSYSIPEKLHKHFQEDLKYLKKIDNKSFTRVKLKKQYGFSLIEKGKTNNMQQIKNNNLYIFGPNIIPFQDYGIVNKIDFWIKNSIERWSQINKIWDKGKVYVILRPQCMEYLNKYCKKSIKNLNIISLSNNNDILNSYLIFEGPSSAVRNNIMFGKKSILFIPKNIFELSKYNYFYLSKLDRKNHKLIQNKKRLFNQIRAFNHE